MNESATVELTKKILDCLRNDPALSEYVKSFSIGGMDFARKLFPFVAIEAPERESETLTIGRNGYMNNMYTIRIFGGTQHILPEVAHGGNDSGKKGILQLSSDLINAFMLNDFGGALAAPGELQYASTAHKPDSAGRIWMTTVVLKGRTRTQK